MASENTISQPRIDYPFVTSQGLLTQYGYSLLVQIVNRVGGPVGEILDGRELSQAIEELRQQPTVPDRSFEIDALGSFLMTQPTSLQAAPTVEDPSAEIPAMRAELAALRAIVEGIQQGMHP